jgi:anaerobic ribonucleoside-triphosphate reductase activating protein
MTLRINQVVFGLGSGVLGASGNRMGVWTQGCSLTKCPGCASTHTWSPDAGKTLKVESLLRLARAQLQPPSGLTVSGGEPTDQPEGVMALITGFRTLFRETEIVLYTGLRWSVLAERFPGLVRRLDVVVAGPYVRSLEAIPIAGSANQEIKLLTPLAKRLFQGWQNWPRHTLQVAHAKTGEVVTVGIPHTPRMARAAQQAGAVEVTWDRIQERKHR